MKSLFAVLGALVLTQTAMATTATVGVISVNGAGLFRPMDSAFEITNVVSDSATNKLSITLKEVGPGSNTVSIVVNNPSGDMAISQDLVRVQQADSACFTINNQTERCSTMGNAPAIYLGNGSY